MLSYCPGFGIDESIPYYSNLSLQQLIMLINKVISFHLTVSLGWFYSQKGNTHQKSQTR